MKVFGVSGLLDEGRADGRDDLRDKAEEGLTKPPGHAAVDQEVDRGVEYDQQVVDVACLKRKLFSLPWDQLCFRLLIES